MKVRICWFIILTIMITCIYLMTHKSAHMIGGLIAAMGLILIPTGASDWVFNKFKNRCILPILFTTLGLSIWGVGLVISFKLLSIIQQGNRRYIQNIIDDFLVFSYCPMLLICYFLACAIEKHLERKDKHAN